ncbi:unnamed protein product [Angiostrongylus costaricensis]|uniref:BACK domain-containing protein n=1 Tax=Angiostrongylus costaricensis TaxID=334426 RepID=A0A0R3PTI9_ANGCS|nr:unnamed protein product [Angiostrongylus costaricensis]
MSSIPLATLLNFCRPLIAKVVGAEPYETVHFSSILAWLKLNWSAECFPSLLDGIEKVAEVHAISAWIGLDDLHGTCAFDPLRQR